MYSASSSLFINVPHTHTLTYTFTNSLTTHKMQQFRSSLAAKQPEVDSLLTLGREIVAEPQTSAANDDLESRLTSFIQDWSDLQLAWQNWFDELHAHREKAGKMGEGVGEMCDGVKRVRGVMMGMFPAAVGMETLPHDLHVLQVEQTHHIHTCTLAHTHTCTCTHTHTQHSHAHAHTTCIYTHTK